MANKRGLRLTPRGRQVLCLAAFSNKEIARHLGVSEQAIKNIWYLEIYPTLRAIARKAGMRWPESRHKQTMSVWVAVSCGVVEICELDPGERRIVSEEVY